MARQGTIAVPRICLAMLAAAGAALWSVPAHPQDSAECAGLADQAAEIACLRQALEASRKALTEAGAPPAPPPSAPAERPQAAAGESRAANLGDEQLPRAAVAVPVEQPDPGRFAAAITASRTDRRGLLVMQLDNGQIWRQADGAELPVRIDADEQVRVEIARSGFGGYRMRFPDHGRRIAVSRLR